MNLTEKNKNHIDSLTIYQLLEAWRHHPIGSEWFRGETGMYWGKRLASLRAKDNDAYVEASKDIGWER